MAVSLIDIVKPQQVPASLTVLYAAPPSTSVRIDKLTVSNPTSAPVTITLNVVPVGGTPGAANQTTNAQSILPNQTWNSPNEVGLVLGAGDAIWATASGANALVIAVGGISAT